MPEENIEKKIIDRFDELTDDEDMFPPDVADDDFRLRALLDYTKAFEGEAISILDAGCGKGRFTKKIADMLKESQVVGVDPAPKFIQIANNVNRTEKITYHTGSLSMLPFEDNKFDFTFCIEVIEHLPNVTKGIDELFRVTKSGGVVIVIDKNILSLHSKFYIPRVTVKKFKEITNKWMYPRDFPFIEKWFYPWEIKKIFKKYCKSTEVKYISESHGLLWKLFPGLNLLCMWRGVKS